MFKANNQTTRYRIKSVANITGLSAHVIRKWEERYRLIHPQRGQNRYRTYTEDDIQFLLYLKSQLTLGETIGQLAQTGEAALRQAMQALPYSCSNLPLPFQSEAQQVIQAAQDQNDAAIQKIIASWIEQLGLEDAMETILFPLLRLIGELWHQGGISISGENSVSRTVRQRLINALHEHSVVNQEQALIACFPDDYHEIVPLTVALILQNRGWNCRYLGSNVSFEVLEVALRRKQAQLIILSCMIEPPPEIVQSWIRHISKQFLPLCRIITGGPGLSPYASLFRANNISYFMTVQDFKMLQPGHRIPLGNEMG